MHATGDLDDGLDVRTGASAGAQPDRVDAQRAEQLGVLDAVAGGQVQVGVRGGDLLGPGVEGDPGQVQVHAVEGARQVGDGDAALAHPQPHRGDAALQVGQHGLPDGGRVGARVALADVPAVGDVAVGAGAAGERPRPRHAGGRQVGGVLLGVERRDPDPVG